MGSTPNVVYQISCKTCNVQYLGSSKGPFRLRFNNYKSHHRAFLDRMSKGTLGTGKSVPQRELHSHFAQSDHNGIEDMQFTLIDSGPNNVITRKRETFWQYKLETFEPKGLNIRNVPPGEFAWAQDSDNDTSIHHSVSKRFYSLWTDMLIHVEYSILQSLICLAYLTISCQPLEVCNLGRAILWYRLMPPHRIATISDEWFGKIKVDTLTDTLKLHNSVKQGVISVPV